MVHNGFARDPNRPNQLLNSNRSITSLNDINSVILNLKNHFNEYWKIVKSKSPKLSFYHNCKTDFSKKTYLSDINNFDERAALTQIRISAHDLKIETGRYSNQPRENRICQWCELSMNKIVVETEKHFILECDLYTEFRRKFTDHPSNLNPLTIESFFPLEDNTVYNRKLGKTILSMFKKRTKFIDSLTVTSQP